MKRTLGAVLAAVGMVVSATAMAAEGQASRQADVARKGGEVMHFDLARTTHFFDDRDTGGIETVLANDGDAKQVELIRAHLSHEASRFGRGDFSDPARIHGADMPGMAQLARAGKKLRVSYAELPRGASLTYASGDAAVVSAIHQWFAAQRSDHGAHAHMHHPGM